MSGRTLHVSPKLALPRDVVTSTMIIYGGKGMGKTNFGSVLSEELSAAGLRYAIIDPMGVWWGLRHSVNGKDLGVEVLILGGIHGDIPIEPTGGAVVADLVVDEDANVIIDISRRPDGTMWSIAERVRFVTDYCKRLYQRQGERRRPLLQFIDEAARFIPQVIRKGEEQVAVCMGAIAVLVEEGRNVAIGVVLLTQRSARLNKDVAELADCMIAFRTVGPNSRRAVLDWLGEHVEKERLKDLDAQVRALPRGSALVVSPGWLEYEGVVAMRARTTFDSSATPKAGEERRASGPGAKPDLARYRERMAATIEKAKADDPKELRKKIAELEAQLRKAPAPRGVPAAPTERIVEKRVVVPILTADQVKQFRASVVVLREIFDETRELGAQLVEARGDLAKTAQAIDVAIARATAPRPLQTSAQSPARPPVVPRLLPVSAPQLRSQNRQPLDDSAVSIALKAGAQRMLVQLAVWHPRRLTVGQLSTLAEVSRGGTFSTYLSALRLRGYLDEAGEEVTATAEGLAVAGDVGRAPRTTEEIVDAYKRQLKAGAQRMLDVLLEAHPDAVTTGDLADRASVSRGGTFSTYLSNLRSAGLIEERDGRVAASPTLYMFEGAA